MLRTRIRVAVVDTKTLTKTGAFSLEGKCGVPAGLAFNVKAHVLFVACRNPAVMAMRLNSRYRQDTGRPADRGWGWTAPRSTRRDPGGLQARRGDGTLTVIKQLSPTDFAVEQTLLTPPGAKTLTLDTKTNRILLITADFEAGASGCADAERTGGPPPRPRRGPMLPNSFTILAVGR